MRMQVEQAVYGEVRGRGHGLRESSTQERIAADIAPQLDLPDAVPAGVLAWSPFVRGFPIGDHYVLARTFLDASASRGGMVLSHALIVSLADICELQSLTTLFELLASSPEKCSASVSTLELNATNISKFPAAYLTGTANALTHQSPVPVVRLGVEGFEHLVDSLWHNFWPALRGTFAFRLSFGPNDIVEKIPPTLVCTPEQLRARWINHRIINPEDQAPSSEAARLIAGQRDAAPILKLAADFGLEIRSLKELVRFERLHHLLASDGDFDAILAAVRLVDGLSNDSTLASGKKTQLIERLIAEIPSASCRQLLLMRNLALAGFADTEPLWAAVVNLVQNMNFAVGDDSDLTEMVLAAIDPDLAFPPWRAAVKAGLAAAARQEQVALYGAVWRWAERSPTAFFGMVDILPAELSIEQRLADEAPNKLKGPAPDELLTPLLKKRWLVAHGAVLASIKQPLEAVRQQLKVDKDSRNGAGLHSALRHASPAQVFECTMAFKDLRLIGLCVDVALDHPTILAGIRGADSIEQKLWGAAIGKRLSLWNAPGDAVGARDTVLVQLARGQAVEVSLLEALAGTPIADLSAAPDRERLWELLPSSHRDAYLQATAAGWLNAALHGAAPTSLEPVLEAAILNSASLKSTLETQSVTVEARLAIIGALPSFSEERFVAWLDLILRVVPFISPATSEQFGSLMATQHWERAAKHLADRYASHRQDLLPAMRVCSSLLGFLTRWKLRISEPSVTEKWTAFAAEACELYPSGPDANELWSRAGGKNSDVPPWSHTGSTRWHKTLIFVRQGGRPKARALLAVMLEDYPSNEKLRFYASDSDIVGWH